MSTNFPGISYTHLMVILLTWLSFPGCYEDEITFTPDMTSRENVTEFLDNFLDVSEYYRFAVSDNTEFVPLDNGWWLEIPAHSLADQNNRVIRTGFIDLKVHILGDKTSDYLYAPSLETDRQLLKTNYCVSLEFSSDQLPLKLNHPIIIYIPQTEDDLMSSLKIFGYSSATSGYQWSQILSENAAIEKGTWTVVPNHSITGLKLTTLNEAQWMALAKVNEEDLFYENNILLTTDNGLNHHNCLVYFVPLKGHNAVKLDYNPASRTFYKNFQSAELNEEGHILILSDSGNDLYSFAMKKIGNMDLSSGLHIKTEIKTIEEIKRVLGSL